MLLPEGVNAKHAHYRLKANAEACMLSPESINAKHARYRLKALT
jgi:hypothetical protein